MRYLNQFLNHLAPLKSSKYLTSKYLISSGVVLGVLVLGGGGFLFLHSRSSNVQGASINAAAEVSKLVEEVGKIIELPVGENPTVATVKDISKLQGQPFFAHAKNGDKVLIYSQAKKAILYDPQTHKVVDIAPINIPSPSPSAGPKVVLRNGTTKVGLTTVVETQLKKTISNLNVVDKENASRDNYDKSLILVFNDGAKDLASSLSQILKADIVKEASGEGKPKDGDIVVILGQDHI